MSGAEGSATAPFGGTGAPKKIVDPLVFLPLTTRALHKHNITPSPLMAPSRTTTSAPKPNTNPSFESATPASPLPCSPSQPHPQPGKCARFAAAASSAPPPILLDRDGGHPPSRSGSKARDQQHPVTDHLLEEDGQSPKHRHSSSPMMMMSSASSSSSEEEDPPEFLRQLDVPQDAHRCQSRRQTTAKNTKASDTPTPSPFPLRKRKVLRNPCAVEMATILPELALTIRASAMSTLRLLLYPKLLARAKRKTRAAQSKLAQQGAIKLSTDFLRKCGSFHLWPEAALNDLASRAQFVHYDRGQFLVHAGEPHVTGASFIVSGTVTSITHPSPPSTGHHNSNSNTITTTQQQPTTMAQQHNASSGSNVPNTNTTTATSPVKKSLHAPLAIGAEGLLDNDKRHSSSIKTASRCDIWHIDEAAFTAVFSQLSSSVKASVVQHAFADRNADLLQKSPPTMSMLRHSSIFAVCPDSVLNDLTRFAQPCCVPKNYIMCQHGDPAERILFLLKGKCTVKKPKRLLLNQSSNINNATSPMKRSSSSLRSRAASMAAVFAEEPDEELTGGAVFGDSAVLTRGQYEGTLTTNTPCECYAVPKHLFDMAIRVIPEVPKALLNAFRTRREEEMERVRESSWARLVARFPFLRSRLSHADLMTLSRLFAPKVWGPLSSLCSSASYCDRVVLIVKGEVKGGINGLEVWSPGTIVDRTAPLGTRRDRTGACRNRRVEFGSVCGLSEGQGTVR